MIHNKGNHYCNYVQQGHPYCNHLQQGNFLVNIYNKEILMIEIQYEGMLKGSSATPTQEIKEKTKKKSTF